MMPNKKEETAATVLPFPFKPNDNDEIIEHPSNKVKTELLDGSALGLPFNWDGVPNTLRNRSNWLLIRVVKLNNGKLDKVPYYNGSWQDTDNQAPLIDVLTYALKKKRKDEILYPAYVLQPGDGCIDLDNHDIAEDQDRRRIHYAHLVNEARGYYAETSVSGTGAHIFGNVLDTTKPFSTRADNVDIQFYAHGDRYVLLTGMLLDGATPVLKPIIHIVNEVPRDSVVNDYAGYKGDCPSQSMALDDALILAKIKQERPKVTDLLDSPLRGMNYEGKSGSDAFMQLLRDISDFCETHEQIYRIAVNSKAFWHENRTDGKQQNYKSPEKYNQLIWNQICKHVEPKGLRDKDVSIDLSTELNKFNPSQADYLPKYDSDFYVMEGVFKFATTGLIVAATNVGKTVVGVGVAGLVALGQSLGDRRTVSSHCFYIDDDNGEDELTKRILAVEHEYNDGKPIEKLHAIQMADFQLHTKDGRIALINKMIELSKGEPIGLIIFDTRERLTSRLISNEIRESMVASHIVDWMKNLARNLGACVLLMDHPPKHEKDNAEADGQDSGKVKNAVHQSLTLSVAIDNGDSKLLNVFRGKNRGNREGFALGMKLVDLYSTISQEKRERLRQAESVLGPVTQRNVDNPFGDTVKVKPKSETAVDYKTMVLIPDVFEVTKKTATNTTEKGNKEAAQGPTETIKSILREHAIGMSRDALQAEFMARLSKGPDDEESLKGSFRKILSRLVAGRKVKELNGLYFTSE